MSLPPQPRTAAQPRPRHRCRWSSSTSTAPAVAGMPARHRRRRRGRARWPRVTCSSSATATIAFIGDALEDPFGFTSSRDREAGLRRELAQGRRRAAAATGSGSARTAATRHASWRAGCSPAADRPTAIFAASDTQALGVIAAARELGLRVPDDLSVIGYDDIEAADYVGPDDGPPAALRVGPAGRRDAARRDRRPRPLSRPSSSSPPSSWSAATTAPPKEGRG